MAKISISLPDWMLHAVNDMKGKNTLSAFFQNMVLHWIGDHIKLPTTDD